jgi:hypothetical protein
LVRFPQAEIAAEVRDTAVVLNFWAQRGGKRSAAAADGGRPGGLSVRVPKPGETGGEGDVPEIISRVRLSIYPCAAGPGDVLFPPLATRGACLQIDRRA